MATTKPTTTKTPAPAKPKATATAKPKAPAAKKPTASTAKAPAVKGTTKSAVTKTGDKIALFIDLDNTGASVKNVQEILSILKNKGTVVFGRLYGYSDEKAKQFEELVAEYKFETAGRLRIKSADSTIDLRLVMDVISYCEQNKPDQVFVWLGQGDLLPLFQRLKELKKTTLTVNIDGFDCKNKFVDEAFPLFSPYIMQSGRIVQSNIKSNIKSIDAYIDPDEIPLLPRKADAPPIYGELSDEELVDDTPLSAEEFNYFTIGSMMAQMKHMERKEERAKDDIGNITKFVQNDPSEEV
jgi:hypothetical protein